MYIHTYIHTYIQGLANGFTHAQTTKHPTWVHIRTKTACTIATTSHAIHIVVCKIILGIMRLYNCKNTTGVMIMVIEMFKKRY